jgi:hypothetical protein
MPFFVSALWIQDTASMCGSAAVDEVTVIQFDRFCINTRSKGYLVYSVKPSAVRNCFCVWDRELMG